MLRFIRNNRGKNLIFEDFLFKINKRKPDIVYFKCCTSTCTSRMALNSNFSVVLKFPGDHNHEKPEQQIDETDFKVSVLASVENNPTRRLKDIYDEKLQSSSSENIPNYSKIRSSMSRTRTKALPPIPESFQNLEIEGDWSKSFKGENFLLHFDRDMGIAIFCTEYALQYLSRASVIFCDGNFSTAPSPFHQLFVIHALLVPEHSSFRARTSGERTF